MKSRLFLILLFSVFSVFRGPLPAQTANKAIAIALTRDAAPVTRQAFVANPLDLSLTFAVAAAGNTFTGADKLRIELHPDRLAVPGRTPLAVIEEENPTGTTYTGTFTAAQLNQPLLGKPTRDFGFVIYGVYDDGTAEESLQVFQTGTLTLAAHPASNVTPAPPNVLGYLTRSLADTLYLPFLADAPGFLYNDGSGTYSWEEGGGGGGATNLSYTASPTNGIVTSSSGTDATLPLGTGTNAGLLAPAQFTKLSNLSGTNTGDETGAGIRSKLGITTLSGSNTGDQDLGPFLTSVDAASAYQPLAAVLTSISGLTDGSGVLSNDGIGNLSWAASGGTGTVTSVSVVSANGFEGTVADPTTTPAITISTSISGLLKGNGTAISAATADTDYLTPSTAASTYVPTTRTVNGQALSGNIIVAAAAGTLTGTTLASNVTTASIRTMGDPASSALGNGLQIKSSLGDVNIFAGGIESTRSPFYINFAKQPFDLSDGALTIAADRTITAALPIAGSITGNAATVTTNASLTGVVTSVGNATSIADGAIALAKLATNPLARANHTGTQAATTITGLPCEFQVAASDLITAITAGTNKAYFRAPFAFTLTAVRASVLTAGTGSTILIDINESGATVLSTKIMIDASEKTSTTAATAPVISDAAIADDAELTIDFDQVGATIAGAGVIVTLIGTR